MREVVLVEQQKKKKKRGRAGRAKTQVYASGVVAGSATPPDTYLWKFGPAATGPTGVYVLLPWLGRALRKLRH